MTVVVSLDPGITTGHCVGAIRDGELVFSVGQDKWKVSDVWHFLNDYDPDWIVCEAFTFRQGSWRTGVELFSRDIIGVVTLYAELMESFGCKLRMQQASMGKMHFTNEKLMQANVYVKAIPHGMDAVRHLLYWYRFGPGYNLGRSGRFKLIEKIEGH